MGEEGFIWGLSCMGGLWGEEGFSLVLSYMGGVCHIWVQQTYIWVLSNMGLGFVKCGVNSKVNLLVLHRPCRKACSFIFGVCQIWVGFCHLWGEERFSSVLSYMGGFGHGFCHIWAVFRSSNYL